ncbi:uncharacterized protein LTR77_006337 [Saxophila tyrrhenica]|uniref:Peptidase A1 domain-containing protein n=1 Tax=Saxophila tyrrhenica TaxID=1690608 RepID=A0AAV9P7L1_9PEZI|nr:hypothetical protein LTR77_006337 [Saxophila tyrrhenica]
MRGVPIFVGTPAQAFSMMAQPFYNDTWIYNSSAAFCNDLDRFPLMTGCLTQRGGLYDASSSSTSSSTMSVHDAGGDPTDLKNVIGQNVPYNTFVTDALSVGQTAFDPYPIGMPGLSLNQYLNNQAAMGLGPNSTLLNFLIDAGTIASRSFSWWWGETGATTSNQMDGQIVLGGYDAAKVHGVNYTQELAPPSQACHSGMVVTISDISLGFPNGTTSSITVPTSLTACLLPHYPLIAYFPQTPYYDNFEAYTGTRATGRGGGDGITFGGMLYEPDEVFQGDLMITLDNNFHITIPNYLLAVPPTSVTQDGSLFTNQSASEILLAPNVGSNSNDLAILGRHFFQAAYLTVDYDSGVFTISQAKATTDAALVSLDRSCLSPDESSNSISSNNPEPSSKNDEPPPDSAESSLNRSDPTLSPGAIAGVAIASVVTIALVAVAAVWCVRRRKRSNGQASEHLSKEDPADSPEHSAAFYEARQSTLQEMAGMADPGELDGKDEPLELSAENEMESRHWRSVRGVGSPRELA